MQSQHTPGPWFSADTHDCPDVMADGGFLIAKTRGVNCEANAQLIAAAPELLAVLEEARLILEYGNGGSDCDTPCIPSNCVCLARQAAILTRVEAALAKAKGESK